MFMGIVCYVMGARSTNAISEMAAVAENLPSLAGVSSMLADQMMVTLIH